jgi:hypothetical protein
LKDEQALQAKQQSTTVIKRYQIETETIKYTEDDSPVKNYAQ